MKWGVLHDEEENKARLDYSEEFSIYEGYVREQELQELADAHNAEVDELQRRLNAVVAILKPGEKPNCMDPKYNPSKMPPLTEYNLDCMWHGMRKQAHARAVAIAEGRTE